MMLSKSKFLTRNPSISASSIMGESTSWHPGVEGNDISLSNHCSDCSRGLFLLVFPLIIPTMVPSRTCSPCSDLFPFMLLCLPSRLALRFCFPELLFESATFVGLPVQIFAPGWPLSGGKDATDQGCGPVTLNSSRLGCRVPRMAPNVEVNLRGLLELDKSDLSGNKDRVQLGSSGAYFSGILVVALDLTCPSTSQLLRSISLVLARASLAEASKPVLSFGCSGGDYTSSNTFGPFFSSILLSNNYKHLDFVLLKLGMTPDFLYYVMQSKQTAIQDPRFTKIINADLIEKYQSIPKRLDEEYHTIKDDTPLVNMYTTGEVTVRGMQIPNELLTYEIKETHAYKDYVDAYKGVEVPIIQPEPIESTQGTNRISNPEVAKQRKSTPAAPLPPSDDAERDAITEATQLSLVEAKTTKVYEEQQNVSLVENRILEEDVENLVEGDDESSGDEFDDTMISDKKFSDRIEPGSHKENTEEIVDNDVKNDDDKHDDAKIDENKDDDDDDHTDHSLIINQRTNSSEIRTEKM
ncbi:hypothetical protein Tco_1504157 [Tanacetum coccineum]